VKKHQITLAITALILIACSPDEIKTHTPISTQVIPTSTHPISTVTQATQLIERTVLTFDQLMNSFDPSSPVDDGAFAMPEDAKPFMKIQSTPAWRIYSSLRDCNRITQPIQPDSTY
jgi:hypothetical protein